MTHDDITIMGFTCQNIFKTLNEHATEDIEHCWGTSTENTEMKHDSTSITPFE